MNPLRSVATHGALLAVAAVTAWITFTRDERQVKKEAEQVEVWSGAPDRVERVAFESPKRTVSLEPRKDSVGRWYVGSVEKEVEQPTPPRPADAGPDAAPAPKPEPKKEKAAFVGVTAAEKFVESVAPLMALRALGKIDDARAEEFGLDKPEGTLRVSIGGKLHALVLAGSTPGGSDRYARDPDRGVVYVIAGDVARSLLSAESRLVEREFHAWKSEEVERVKITAGQKARELVRIEENKGFWADPATPTTKDETASNWMSKLDKLRVMKHLESLPKEPGAEAQVVRVEYFSKPSRSLGWVEIARVPGQKQGENDYVARTEFTRWWTSVLKSSAEQVDQDLGSVVK
jgi:hypothetical protein